MLLNKNDDIELHIDSVSLTGSGVGRYNGLAVFVPATAPGDFIKAHIIKAKKSYAVGKCIKITEPSPDRTENDCPAYPGCGGCAEAILAGKAPVTACAPAGPENAAKIAAIMGMEAPSGDKMVAHVLCNGGCNAKDNFEYRGVKDCLAATKVCGGDAKACRYGCFGFGSCVAACKFDAIHVENGVAVVDKEKCTNCGACRAACPHHLIVEVPYKQKVFVNCSNKDKGPAVTKVCANSCIACGMCERTCKFDAIHVENNVAVIDYSKCKNCTMCAKACPKNAIEPIPTPEEKEKFKAAQKAAAEKKAAAAKAAAEAAEAPKAE